MRYMKIEIVVPDYRLPGETVGEAFTAASIIYESENGGRTFAFNEFEDIREMSITEMSDAVCAELSARFGSSCPHCDSPLGDNHSCAECTPTRGQPLREAM